MERFRQGCSKNFCGAWFAYLSGYFHICPIKLFCQTMDQKVSSCYDQDPNIWAHPLIWINFNPIMEIIIHSIVWDAITYTFPHLNGCSVEVWEWKINSPVTKFTDAYVPWLSTSLQCSYNERVGVSNNQSRDCLLNRLFRHRSKKTSKLRVTSLCAGEFIGDWWIPCTKGQ